MLIQSKTLGKVNLIDECRKPHNNKQRISLMEKASMRELDRRKSLERLAYLVV